MSLHRIIATAFLAAFCLLGLTGCAPSAAVGGNLFPGASITPSAVTGIYTYSFLQQGLDPDPELKQHLSQFRDKLTEALRARGLRVETIEVSETPGLQTGGDDIMVASSGNARRSHIPVREVIAANQSRERASGAPYRLLLTPRATFRRGPNHLSGVIMWALQPTTSNTFIATGSISYQFNAIIAPHLPTQQMVDKLLAEFERLNILAPVANARVGN